MAPVLHALVAVRVWALLVLCVAAGCYSPSLRDCTVACASAGDCANGQACTADGFCAASAELRCEAATADGGPDTALPDATSLCELGCPTGSCVGGVCVIDCTAPGACPMEVTCPPNVPCRVVCGDGACRRKVSCGLASTCEVQCNGLEACGEEVVCGRAPCTVTCAGIGSCKRRVKCKDACRCDVTCSGATSCPDAAECPMMDACRLGHGCTSGLAGCDRCDQ